MAKSGGVALRLVVVGLGVVLAGPVAAQQAANGRVAGQLASGQMWFKKYCATCHGVDGKGGGPTAKALKEDVPDLTTLAKRNNGQFPYIMVLDVIDGQQPTPSHGSAEMPAWGETFQSDTGVDTLTEAAVRGKLMLITDYIRSIQQK